MIVPAVGSISEPLMYLVNTLAGSATLRRLFGAADATAAKARIFESLALDDGTQPLPRAIVRPLNAQISNLMGYAWTVNGQMLAYVQYEAPSDEDILAWYSITGDLTAQDRRRHMNNLFGQIAEEMRALAREAGCLEFSRLEEFDAGEIDPVTENGVPLMELIYVFHREGLP